MTKYEIAANIEIADLSNFDGKMPAATQREIFGANIFGKKSITIRNESQGAVEVRYSAAYGTDQVLTVISFEEIARALAANRPLSF